MSGLRDHIKTVLEDQRLCVLCTLNEAQGSRANEGVLQGALSMFGHDVTRDQVSSLTQWLEEQSLVSVEALRTDIRIISLTERGQDVAAGRIVQPGVKKPRLR